MSSFKTFAIAPSQNTGTQHDANGAFHPGAQKFAAAYNSPWRTYENSGSAKKVKQNFYDAIDQFCPSSIDLFAYFGHGIPSGLPSPHIYEADIDDFVQVLAPKMSKPFVCVLYACSSGAANGFSTKLREKLGGDVWVYGHTTVGHSYMNPDVSEVMADNTPAYQLLYPYGSDMRAAWSEALHYTDLWLRYPLLYKRALDAEVNARRLLGTWEVSGAGAARIYEFDNPGTAWNQNSDVDIDAPPSGTVRAVDPKKRSSLIDQGTWEITDRVNVKWRGGGMEFWPLPLKAVGQQFTAGVTTQTAKRLNHTLGHGRLQG
jgi:hypothetical protein